MIKIFNHYIHKRTVLQLLLDFGLILGTVLLATGIHTPDLARAASAALPSAVLLAIAALTINAALGFYQRVHNRTVAQSRARAVLSLCLILPLAYVVLRVLPLGLEDQDFVSLSVVGGVLLMLIHRVHVGHSSAQSMMRQRVLVFGTGTRAKLVGRTLQKSDPHVDLVGYYASPNEAVAEVSAWGILSPNTSLTDIVMEQQVDEIVVALAERRGGSMPLRELLDCKLQGVRVVDMATHFEKTLGQIRLDSVSAGWLIFGDGFSQGWLSGGPILYLQERVGLNGRLFNVIKFRSMRTDAEMDGQPRWATAQDDRVTRVGRILRKLRIDELPQLFSVLSGDMSLVGPRPERPYFVDKLTQELPYFAVRQSVKPGVTGWAQVRYHYGSSVEDAAEKLQYDLYYVKNHTLFLDLVILFETVGVVLTAKGAQ
jgi:lipopolysaccharide/colanic/teichoic acid biosynthesis glycosyltransferase